MEATYAGLPTDCDHVPVICRSTRAGLRIGRALGSAYLHPGMLTAHYLSIAAIAAVAIVLVLGLFNMMRGGSPSTSQKLMRWRVGLQFVAIIVVMTALWMRG